MVRTGGEDGISSPKILIQEKYRMKKISEHKRKKLKQIAIDEDAWGLLCKVKEELRKTGRTPSLSDAIRHVMKKE